MRNFGLYVAVLMTSLIFCASAYTDSPSWQINYKAPTYFTKTQENKDHEFTSYITDPEDTRISGYLFELTNINSAAPLSLVTQTLIQYAEGKQTSIKTILSTPDSHILFLKKDQSNLFTFSRQFALITSWLLFNRRDNQLAIRPIIDHNKKGSFLPEQVLHMNAPAVNVGDTSMAFLDPEKVILDGYHIHLDYLEGQKKEAEALYNSFVKIAAKKKLIFSDLDWYPPNSNGPHKRAGWEIKFERAGSLVMESYGYALMWLMLNHGNVPIYAHSKSWIFGENEKRLSSHLDNALYSGAKPDLNQRFFYSPGDSLSGLYRWDTHLPISKTISIEHSLARQKAVLEFWFGKHYEKSPYPMEQSKLWFNKQKTPVSALDKQIKEMFSQDLFLFVNGFYNVWLDTPRGKLAAIILLDQFPRNMYRGKAMAFAYDKLARTISENAITAGEDKQLTLAERLFLYLPFEHSETIEDQKKAVSLMHKLKEDAPEQYKTIFQEHYRMAVNHQLAIEKFQYFPSRNKNYGRVNTEEELAFMKKSDAEF